MTFQHQLHESREHVFFHVSRISGHNIRERQRDITYFEQAYKHVIARYPEYEIRYDNQITFKETFEAYIIRYMFVRYDFGFVRVACHRLEVLR